MPTLQDVVTSYLEEHRKSVRNLAEETSIGYPTLLGVVNRGKLPRKAEHRELLRRVIGIEVDRWSEILMASTGDGVEIPESGPLTLQQLVTREMYAQNHTEQSLAKNAGLPYPTVMGITRKASIPRHDSLMQVARVLGISEADIEESVETSKAARRGDGPAADDELSDDEIPHLSDLVMDCINLRQQSIAAFAKDLGIGYLTVARFIETGKLPRNKKVLDAFEKILDLDPHVFQVALERSRDEPRPVEVTHYDNLVGPNGTPLQHALAHYMRDHHLTLKSLAKKAGLSQVTVSRLLKQGQPPTRAITHQKLQSLLDLDPASYETMISEPTDALTSTHKKKTRKKTKADQDDYEPQETTAVVDAVAEKDVDDDSLESLIARLNKKQRNALRSFLASII